MGRRQLKTRDDFVRALRNGRGIGKGINYRPWVGIRDVPSSGRSSLIYGLTVPREYETLSDLETYTFYPLDRKKDVIDIREQFPIFPRDLVIGIAKRYGITYPNVPKTKEPAILSTDFVATVVTGQGETYVPIDCKYRSDLLKKRELEKLEIKRLFWAALGFPLMIVTEKEVDPIASENLAFISGPLRGELAPTHTAQNPHEIMRQVPPRTYTIESLIDRVRDVENVDEDVGRHILFHLIWYHGLKIDIGVSIEETGLISVQGWDPHAIQATQERVDANTA
jgi:hypothetical protein